MQNTVISVIDFLAQEQQIESKNLLISDFFVCVFLDPLKSDLWIINHLSFMDNGFFCLQDLIIGRAINQLTCYKLMCSHWLKYSLQSIQPMHTDSNGPIVSNKSDLSIFDFLIFDWFKQELTSCHIIIQAILIPLVMIIEKLFALNFGKIGFLHQI